jgi:predicted TIM-barrel fold metal-dependent hydrolase
MNIRRMFISVVVSTRVLVSLAGVSTCAQTAPLADHHAHLQSPAAARLLNEGASRESHALAGVEKERPSTASDLIVQLDAAGVRCSVALSDAYRLGSPFVRVPNEAAAVDAENEWTLGQVQMYPERLVGFCSVNPVRPYALAAIEHCADLGLRGGLKLHLANAKFSFDDPAQVQQLRKVFAAADRLRMPILIHLRSGEVWHGRHNVQVFMEKVLLSASHVPVQVAHLGGWGGYDRATDDTLAAFAKTCEEHPDRCRNLYFDLSAVELSPAYATAAPGSDERLLWDEQKDFADGPERLATGLRRIGFSRILFGTDWPNETAGKSIDTLWHGLRLSPAEINQIFSNVAPYFPKQGIDPRE